MTGDPPPFTSLLLTPLLTLAFACGVVGSFVIWRLRIAYAMGSRHVPFHLHVPRNGHSSVRQVTTACLLGVLAMALPVSLLLHV
jgi:hypothetical protein